MSLLPTAHAGQAYGARRVDYFTVSGQVSASDANSGRLTDHDGIEHDVRLVEPSSAFAPGDSATILRIQSGPNRRSRPVAIVNHSRGMWMRASPDATTILAKAGVTRSFNWWLAIFLMIVTALAAVWPVVHIFLAEINAAMMAEIPAINVFAFITTQLPGLAGWRLESALPSGMVDAIVSLGLIASTQLTETALYAGAALLAILAFAVRDWRLLYMPALAVYTLVAGAILGGADAALIIVAGTLILFMVGGLINRIRDSGRFGARVERLAEHVLRNPPQEEVRTNEITAAAALATAGAAAPIADTPVEENAATPDPAEAVTLQADPAEDTAPAAEAVAETADTPEPSIADAGDADTVEDGPDAGAVLAAAAAVGATALALNETDEDDAEALEDEVVGDNSDTAPDTASEAEAIQVEVVDAEVVDAEAADTVADAEPAAAEDEAETASTPEPEAPAEAAPAMEAADAAEADETGETSADPVEPQLETSALDSQPDAAVQIEDEDDLPSLDDVAAAAALSEAENAAGDAATDPVIDLEDERTLPVAPPPPMPSADSGAAATPAENESIALEGDDEAVANVAAPASEAETMPVETAAADIEPPIAEPQSDDTMAATPAMADDPLIDDAPDPMTGDEAASDFAPGAPDIELDETRS